MKKWIWIAALAALVYVLFQTLKDPPKLAGVIDVTLTPPVVPIVAVTTAPMQNFLQPTRASLGTIWNPNLNKYRAPNSSFGCSPEMRCLSV